MYTVYENVLSKESFTNLHKRLCVEPGWMFGQISDVSLTDDTPIPFWKKDLTGDKFFTETVFAKICNLTNKNYTIIDVYANGQTYGLPGNLHIDDNASNSYTFLYYTNPEWFVQWGGATIFTEVNNFLQDKLTHPSLKGNTEKTNMQTFFPHPNTGLLFKSNITHVGMEPTRHCKQLRITVAYKLIETRD